MDSPRPPGPRPLELAVGDSVELRRAHPCGGRDWRVFRVGADIGLACAACGRRVMLDRRALERRVVRVTTGADVRGEGAG
ncbi:MAG: DUF951 domain-containing protein [Chloroflexi bacterium]|jgi:hypothetical protein|nr:DUF951 domain-containing protein [Chloroflexota bacterium]